jgi:glycosyltransferase involved in cell wall biosynthesis
MKKLSILICSLNSRKNYLDRLLNILEKQLTDEVEVLVDLDNGEKSIGEKRNFLLEKAEGEYITFIDDDDTVPNYYVSEILEGIKENPDVIGIHLIMDSDGKRAERTYHSLKYQNWYQEVDVDNFNRQKYYRNPNHLNPVKREIALKVKFPNINNGEDRAYSMNILPLLQKEYYIPIPMYFYEYRSRK